MLPMSTIIALLYQCAYSKRPFVEFSLEIHCMCKELNRFTVMPLYWPYHKIMIIKQKTKND